MTEKMQVEAIKTGTVIDHIPPGNGIKILKKLQLDCSKYRITLGFNLPSDQLGLKDIIKVKDRLFTQNEANELGLYAPKATINVIKNYKVSRKFAMPTPEILEDILKCPNSNCISQNEPVNTVFFVKNHEDELYLRCKYCEKSFRKDIIAEF